MPTSPLLIDQLREITRNVVVLAPRDLADF